MTAPRRVALCCLPLLLEESVIRHRRCSMGIAVPYHAFLKQHHGRVLLGWFVAVLLGAPLAVLFIGNCTDVFEPPEGSAAFEAKAKLREGNLAVVRLHATVVLVQSTSGKGVLGSGLVAFEAGLRRRVMGCAGATTVPCAKYDGAYNTQSGSEKGTIKQFRGYAFFSAISPLLAGKLVSKDGRAALITIQQDPSLPGVDMSFANFLDSAMADLCKSHPGLRARQTGYGAFARDAVTGTEKDLAKMDSVALPLALFVLSVVLNSWKVMLIPPAAITASVCASLGLMYPVSCVLTTISFVPSVMMSSTIAFSFDYSLFVLARYREELRAGVGVEAAVLTTLENAGHTVVTSGLTLAFAFCMMILFPIDILNSMGIGAALAVLLTIAVNLSLTPALLLHYPEFFKDAESLNAGPWYHALAFWRTSAVGSAELDAEFTGAAAVSDAPNAAPSDAEMKTNTWYRFSKKVQRNRWPVIALALAITAPFAMQIPKENPLFSLQFVAPRGSPAWLTFLDLQKLFGAGLTFPSALVIQPKNGGTVASPAFFARSQKAIAHLRAATDTCHATKAGTYPPPSPSCIHGDYTGIMVASQLAQVAASASASGGTSPAKIPAAAKGLEQPAIARVKAILAQSLGEQAVTAAQLNCSRFPSSGCIPYAAFAIPAGCHRTGISQRFQCDAPNSLLYDCKKGALAKALADPTLRSDLALVTAACGGVMCKIAKCCDVPAKIAQAEALVQGGCAVQQFLYNNQVSTDKTITYVSITLNIDPFDPKSLDWLKSVRAEVKKMNSAPGAMDTYYVGMGAADILDASGAALSRFPMLVVVTNTVVLAFLAYNFGSLVLPLRSISSIGITLCIIYGLAVLVFQDGWLGFLHAPQVQAWGGISWLIPLMVFSIITGLSLDYDIFLLDRVVEYRAKGHDDDESISLGLAKTGRIITAAGTIMAVAFGGMLLSSSTTINMLAFYLTTAVILDTFVVRTCLVPAMMFALGKHNWWPRRFEQAQEMVTMPT